MHKNQMHIKPLCNVAIFCDLLLYKANALKSLQLINIYNNVIHIRITCAGNSKFFNIFSYINTLYKLLQFEILDNLCYLYYHINVIFLNSIYSVHYNLRNLAERKIDFKQMYITNRI